METDIDKTQDALLEIQKRVLDQSIYMDDHEASDPNFKKTVIEYNILISNFIMALMEKRAAGHMDSSGKVRNEDGSWTF
jgi:hypothetical protein